MDSLGGFGGRGREPCMFPQKWGPGTAALPGFGTALDWEGWLERGVWCFGINILCELHGHLCGRID